MIILGIDPGKTTGFVRISYSKHGHIKVLEKGHVVGFRAIDKLKELIVKSDVIIIENFTLWPNSAVGVSNNDPTLITVQIIGAIKYIFRSHEYANKKVYWQDSSLQNSNVKRAVKELGYHFPGKRHCNSAMAHIISYLFRVGKKVNANSN